jgi:hypothetical protein
MSNDMKKHLIAVMRRVRCMLSVCDGTRHSVVMPGEIIDLAAYGQRLQAAFADDNEADAKHLLAAIF